MTRYEQIKNMTEGQMCNFLFWFSLLQLPTQIVERANLEDFEKEIAEFLGKEVMFDEYDDKKIII